MGKVLLLKSVILAVLLIGSIFTALATSNANASLGFVTVVSTNSGQVTTLTVSNSIGSTSDMTSFIVQINGGIFKSFKLQNGWTGAKTSPTTLAFSALNPLKPGKSVTFDIKTDQQNSLVTWKATDANNVELGSGEIGAQSSNQQSSNQQSSNQQSSNQQSSNQQSANRGILDSTVFRIIPALPSPGSHIRVLAQSLSASTSFDLYIENEKIGTVQSSDRGNIMSTLLVPNTEQPGSVNFILKDQQGNQKTFSTSIKQLKNPHIAIQQVPLTISIDPIIHRGETKLVTGTGTPGDTITFTLFDGNGNPITTLTSEIDKDGKYSIQRTVPNDIAFGKYSVTVADGKSQASKQFSIVSTHPLTISTEAKRYEPGQTVLVNGTSINNQIVSFEFIDSTGHQVYSTDANVTSSGTISAVYHLDSSAIHGTYTVIATQGNDEVLAYFGVAEDPSPPITAKMDKLSYVVTDKPVISVTGPESSTLNLVIVDPSDKQKFSDLINLGPDGQATYSFNLTAYTSGIYSAVVSHAEQKIQRDFAVGLATGAGKIILKTIKDTYLAGDNIIIIGNANPNTLLQLSLTDPSDVLIKTLNVFTDKTGHFSSFDFKIPPVATPGTWRIDATSGVSHQPTYITVKSTKQGITVSLDRTPALYTRGDLLKISGSSAGNTAAVKITIGTNSTITDTLPTSSTNAGDYSTFWQVPKNIQPGTYTIQASSATGKASISVKIQ